MKDTGGYARGTRGATQYMTLTIQERNAMKPNNPIAQIFYDAKDDAYSYARVTGVFTLGYFIYQSERVMGWIDRYVNAGLPIPDMLPAVINAVLLWMTGAVGASTLTYGVNKLSKFKAVGDDTPIEVGEPPVIDESEETE
jgi:hypothetical protein